MSPYIKIPHEPSSTMEVDEKSFHLLKTERLSTDEHGNFIEPSTGRTIALHGINLGSCSKLPDNPYQTTYMRPDKCGFYTEADTVSFVNRPFPLDEAYEHLTRLKMCGYNTIRFIFTWEAIEHEGPGIYDLEYVQYVIELLRIIQEVGGLYVLLDPHQDAWSKFSGGSGSPIWTLYAAGLEPENFDATSACKLHNLAPNPEKYTKMVWSTNYFRLAPMVMFTMFFSGKKFTPHAIINGQNIQDYLQDHFINAVAFLFERIKADAPDLLNGCLMGIECMNEPNSGLYGFGDLSKHPENQTLKLDETPTPIQSFRLGMGKMQYVDVYELGMFGSRKVDDKKIDPHGATAWIKDDSKDKKYGFHRDPKWKLGTCIFALEGVWNAITGELLQPEYFHHDPKTNKELDETQFINTQYIGFWKKFKTKLREVDEEIFLFMEPPVLEVPPEAKGTNAVDKRTGIAIHYYDGMSLVFKSWNRLMNVDTVGIMRGKYKNPIFGIVLGEKRIRDSIRNQLRELKQECKDNVGIDVPVIMTETGMPFDMDDKKVYENGDYRSQESANDALGYALEGSDMDFTYWCYDPENCHKWGDRWNLEDLSIFSRDDIPNNKLGMGNMTSSTHKYNEWMSSISSASSSRPPSSSKKDSNAYGVEVRVPEDSGMIGSLYDGIRVPNALIRPYATLVNGTVAESVFDLSKTSYLLKVDTRHKFKGEAPTIVFLPATQFHSGKIQVVVSSGSTVLKTNPIVQALEWTHDINIGVIEMKVTQLSEDSYRCSTFERVKSLLSLLTCGLL